MNVTPTAVVAAIGLSAALSWAGVAHAVLLVAPEPCPTCAADQAPGIPAMKCWPYGRVGAGNAVSGGGRPSYPPPCR